MPAIFQVMVIRDSDGTALEDQCSLCLEETPWVVDVRCYDHLIHICLTCIEAMQKAARLLRKERDASRA